METTGVSVEELAWLAGTWRCEIWNGEFEEQWTHADGGTMIGMGRHVAGGKTTFIEFFSLEPSDEGLVLWMLLGAPSKGPKNPAALALASWDGETATFRNRHHSDPAIITYRRIDDGRMQCYVAGKTPDKDWSETFDFRRG